MKKGKVKFFVAPRPPKNSIESCLPPPGEYLDFSTISNSYPKEAFGTRGNDAKCSFCWASKYISKAIDCKLRCKICDEMSHAGQLCPSLYLEYHFWQQRGVNPKATVHLRSSPEELAYLIIGGVFLYKPNMHFWDPIIANPDHPAVQKYYEAEEKPRRMGKLSTEFSTKGYGVYENPPAPVAQSTSTAQATTAVNSIPSALSTPLSAQAPAPALSHLNSRPIGPAAEASKLLPDPSPIQPAAMSSEGKVQSAKPQASTVGACASVPLTATSPQLSDGDETLSEHVDEANFKWSDDFKLMISREYHLKQLEKRDSKIVKLRTTVKEKDGRIRELEAKLEELENKSEVGNGRDGTNKRVRRE